MGLSLGCLEGTFGVTGGDSRALDERGYSTSRPFKSSRTSSGAIGGDSKALDEGGYCTSRPFKSSRSSSGRHSF